MRERKQSKSARDRNQALADAAPQRKEGLVSILQKNFGPLNPNYAVWANGLKRKEAAHWLVDCYRLRVSDDLNEGQHQRGRNLPNAGKQHIIEDFLVFCKLAVRHKVYPPGWDWPLFLSAAAKLLSQPFKLKDAERKYGRENVFLAFMGDRSLRITAELVYGFGYMAAKDSPGQEFAALQKAIAGNLQQLLLDGDMFVDVGGVQAWRLLHQQYAQYSWLFDRLKVLLGCVLICAVVALFTMLTTSKPKPVE